MRRPDAHGRRIHCRLSALRRLCPRMARTVGPWLPAHRGPITAYRRLVGTSIAAVSEEASGILSSDVVESGSECLLQRHDGTRGDPAQVDFHLGPSGFDRTEVCAVGGQIAISEA